VKRHLRTLAPIVFVLLALAAAAWAIGRDATEVRAALHDIGALTIVESTGAALMALACTCLSWRALLAGLGAEVGLGESWNVYFVSQLGKYLPGSAWPVLAQMEFARRKGIARSSMLAANVLSIAVGLVTGLLVAAAVLPFAAPSAVSQYWWAFAAIVPLVALLHPAVLPTALNWVLARLGRDVAVPRAPLGSVLRSSLWALASWMFYGLHAYALTDALHGGGARGVAVSFGGFALAVCAGILFLPAPAGAGVRDAVLIATFGLILGTGAALSSGLLSRGELILADVLMALAAMLASRRRRPAGEAG
jgi:hypothetical protein